MKDIKSYVIGFLTCACLFLIMGQTKNDNQVGRYQVFLDRTSDLNTKFKIVDTTTGKTYSYWTDMEANIYRQKAGWNLSKKGIE